MGPASIDSLPARSGETLAVNPLISRLSAKKAHVAHWLQRRLRVSDRLAVPEAADYLKTAGFSLRACGSDVGRRGANSGSWCLRNDDRHTSEKEPVA